MVRRLSLPVLFFVVLGGFYFLYKTYKTKDLYGPFIPTITPTVAPIAHKTQDVVSPDMKKTLVMKEHRSENSVTHTFLTLSEKDKTPKEIYKKTVDLAHSITIPFNTWSPGGNKYFFLKEGGDGQNSYIVLSSLGKALTKNSQTVNVEDKFSEKYTDYKITDVTGWAAPTLLVVNTDNADGTLGPSFWFDVSSLSFIKLSTRFN